MAVNTSTGLLLPNQPPTLSALLPLLLALLLCSAVSVLLQCAALPAGCGLLLLTLLLGFVSLPGRALAETGGDFSRCCCCCCCVPVCMYCSSPTGQPCCALVARLPGVGRLLEADVGFCPCCCCC